MRRILPLFPTMASFGPLMLVMGSLADGWMRLLAYLGAMMTSGAFFVLFALLARQATEIQALSEE
jgi:hypothetical protein